MFKILSLIVLLCMVTLFCNGETTIISLFGGIIIVVGATLIENYEERPLDILIGGILSVTGMIISLIDLYPLMKRFYRQFF